MQAIRTVRMLGAFAAMAVGVAIVWTVGAGSPVAARSRPCGCSDIPDVEDKLELTEKQIEAWKQVLEEIETGSSNAANSGDGAGERFCTLMGRPKDCVKPANKDKSRAGGVNPDTLEPEVNKKYEDANCDIIVDSVYEHERMHPQFMRMNRFNYRVIFGILGWNYRGGARVQCWNELFAHEEQKLFLQERLAALKRECGPMIAAYPSAADKEAQKQKVAAAARRVAAYASTIKGV